MERIISYPTVEGGTGELPGRFIIIKIIFFYFLFGIEKENKGINGLLDMAGRALHGLCQLLIVRCK